MPTQEVRFRATPDEIARLDRKAEAQGYASRAEYIRDRLGLAPPRPKGGPLGNRNNPHGRKGRPGEARSGGG